MQKLWIFLCLFPFSFTAQTIEACRQRFDTYLNFRNGLSDRVKFETDAIILLDQSGAKELVFYGHELNMLSDLFEHSSFNAQEKFLKWKGIRKLSRRQCDSLLINIDDRKGVYRQKTAPLQGYRIAIDPGHFSTDLKDARIEQKYLYFVKDSVLYPNDTIKLFESLLTFNTAKQLQTMLEAQGATVMLTRSQNNYTSFNCTYEEWLMKYKHRTLDSLKQAGLIPSERYNKLIRYSDYKVFWEFFRDYDLANRANKINRFEPHASVIIHFNVDETNEPWKKGSDKNFTMAFIGGAVTEDNLNRSEGRVNFLRLLFTDQLNRSEKLAGTTVLRFNKNLNVPIADAQDAVYLKENCLPTSSRGVFSRNLILCRKINSPLVYGESLYQDNSAESDQLMRFDTDAYGIKSNLRLGSVAKSYYEALLDFLTAAPH